MKVQIGKLNAGHVLDHTPTRASEMFTAAGDWKATLSGSIGEKLTVLNDLHFNKFIGIEQSQNAPCNFGPSGHDGTLFNDPPFSAVVHNQAQVMIYKTARPGYCDVRSAQYLTFELGSSRPITVEANIG